MAQRTQPDKNFLHRLGDAVKAFRVQFSGTGSSGQWSYASMLDQITRAWASWTSRRSSINFAQEVGDLTQSSLVMAAVNWVGRALPEAMPRVVEEDDEGKESPVVGHPLVKLLRRPNPYYSGSTMAKAIALNWILNGNVYLLKQRNARGQVIRLYCYPYWTVRPVRESADELISYYEVNINGQWQKVDGYAAGHGKMDMLANVIHLRDGIDPYNDMLGLSPLASLLREIFTDNEAAFFTATVMKNAGVIPYVLTPTDSDVDVDVATIKEKLLSQTQGDKAGEPIVLSTPLRLDKVGITPAEMVLDKLRDVPEERVAAVIGIDRMVLYGASRGASTFSNFQQATESAYENYMVPLWRYLDEEFTHQLLLRDFEAEESNRRVQHDLSKVRALQDDEDALHKRITMDYVQGVITRAEARGKLGFPADDARDNVFLNRTGQTFINADDPQSQFPAKPEMPVPAQLPLAAQPRQLTAAPDEAKRALPMEYERGAVKRAGTFKFSSTQIDLSPPVSTQMQKFAAQIPDDQLAADGREAESHVTIKYGLHANDAADVQAVLAGEMPVRLAFGPTDYFAGDEFDVVYVSVNSPELDALNRKVSSQLPNTSTFSEYVPHATIAYLKPGLGAQYANQDIFEGLYTAVSVVADAVTFSNRDGEKTTIKLTGDALPQPPQLVNGKDQSREVIE